MQPKRLAIAVRLATAVGFANVVLSGLGAMRLAGLEELGELDKGHRDRSKEYR